MSKIKHYVNNNLDIGGEYQRIFGSPMPTGKFFCKFHHNVNTPAAKRYGNIIKCFSCNRAYTVYDLLSKFDPDRIKEISETIIVPEVKEIDFTMKLITVDRTQSIQSVLNEIKEHYGKTNV